MQIVSLIVKSFVGATMRAAAKTPFPATSYSGRLVGARFRTWAKKKLREFITKAVEPSELTIPKF